MKKSVISRRGLIALEEPSSSPTCPKTHLIRTELKTSRLFRKNVAADLGHWLKTTEISRKLYFSLMLF